MPYIFVACHKRRDPTQQTLDMICLCKLDLINYIIVAVPEPFQLSNAICQVLYLFFVLFQNSTLHLFTFGRFKLSFNLRKKRFQVFTESLELITVCLPLLRSIFRYLLFNNFLFLLLLHIFFAITYLIFVLQITSIALILTIVITVIILITSPIT